MHVARNSISTCDFSSTFSSSKHSVSPKDPEWYSVKILDTVLAKVFSTLNPTWVVFCCVMMTGRSGYIVSPWFSIRIGRDGGHGVGASVGAIVGNGFSVAALLFVGLELGYMLAEGASVGAEVGSFVGSLVGDAVGTSVGDELGYMLSVGASEGAELG